MTRAFEIFQLLSWAVFLVFFVGRTLHLRLARGVDPITIVRGKRPAEALSEGLLVVALPLWLYEIVAFAWPLSFHFVPDALGTVVVASWPLQTAGALLVASGLLIFALSLAAFGESWRVGIDTERPGELVTGGIFRLSRNPIFVFMNLYAWGTFLLSGRLLFLLFAVVASVGLHLQIRREERFLTATYGEAYRRYCAATPRYLGRPGGD